MLATGILALIGFGIIAWWIFDEERKINRND